MKKIVFSCEVITPMFLGGADDRNAELRPPSIKGTMRFWWRAVNVNNNISNLKEKEDKIFGGAGDKANKSSFSLRILYDDIKPIKKEFPDHPVQVPGKSYSINILEYLAYGTYERDRKTRKNVFNREYYSTGTKFDIVVLFREEESIKDILISFYLLSAFGGLGSRSRNGFGNFNVVNREVFSDLGKEYVDNIMPTKKMLEQFTKLNNIPNYSAFSNGIKLFKSRQNFDTWDKSLAEIGKIYKSCRKQLENPHNYNKRQYIGAPLDPPQHPDKKSLLDRRSKPYFIKIVKIGQNQYTGYVLYLASKYCEGLCEDRNKKSINNHAQLSQEFSNICNEFNGHLQNNMETII